jgi:glucosamine-6-phosphate deaminase
VKVSVYAEARDAASAVADRIAHALAVRPSAVLGLPTGRTTVPLYRDLAARAERGVLDFSRATTFNLDEFLGLAPDHPASYRRFMQRHLFSRVNLAPSRIHFLDGAASDPAAECARYESAIASAGGIDLQVLGLGNNGHIGFNEPAAALEARTHRTRLSAPTRRANTALFGNDVRRVPHEALSMGMATILHARAIVLLATGRGKARCVRGAVYGRVTTRLPASFLQLHRDVEFVVDRQAARELTSPRAFSRP